MKDKPINIDNNSIEILGLNKSQLEKSALSLKSGLDPLDEYSALYKFQYFIKYRMECLKELAKEDFTEKFEGSQTERLNGFSITLMNKTKYEYSGMVKQIEKDVKDLQEHASELREQERENGTAKVIESNEILALTLK